MSRPAFTVLDTIESTVDGASFQGASASYKVGRLYALLFSVSRASGGPPADPTVTLAGAGSSWTKLRTDTGPGANWKAGVYLFRPAATITDAVRLSWGADTQTGLTAVVVRADAFYGGDGILAAILDSAYAAGSGTAPSASLSGPPDPSSGILSFCALAANTALAPAFPLVELTETPGHATPNARAAVATDNGTPDATALWSIASSSWVCYVLEVKGAVVDPALARAPSPVWGANGDYTIRENPANPVPMGRIYGAVRDYIGLTDDPFWRGTWTVAKHYLVGDGVVRNSVSYIAIAESTGVQPPNAAFWATPYPGGSLGVNSVLRDVGPELPPEPRRLALSWKLYRAAQPSGQVLYYTYGLPPVSGATWASGALTVNTSAQHGIVAGQQVGLASWVPSSINGLWTVLDVLSTTAFRITMADPGPITGVGTVRVGGVTGALPPLSGATWSGGVLTVTSTLTHGLVAGQVVMLTDWIPRPINGTWTILDTPTPTTFRITMADPGAVTTVGKGTTGGIYDADIIRQADWIISRSIPMSGAVHHEPDHRPSGFTVWPGHDGAQQPGEFAAALKYVYDLMLGRGVTTLWPGMCLDSGGNSNAGTFYDPGGSMRFLATDAYIGNPTRDWLNLFTAHRNFAASVGIDFEVWETNTHNTALTDAQMAAKWDLAPAQGEQLGVRGWYLWIGNVDDSMDPSPPGTLPLKWAAYVNAGLAPYWNPGATGGVATTGAVSATSATRKKGGKGAAAATGSSSTAASGTSSDPNIAALAHATAAVATGRKAARRAVSLSLASLALANADAEFIPTPKAVEFYGRVADLGDLASEPTTPSNHTFVAVTLHGVEFPPGRSWGSSVYEPTSEVLLSCHGGQGTDPLHTTGTTLGFSVMDIDSRDLFHVNVPTTLGFEEVVGANGIVGGGHCSDVALVDVGGDPWAVFVTWPYSTANEWDQDVYGQFPSVFVARQIAGVWDFDPAHAWTADDMAALSVLGTLAFPERTNSFGNTYRDSLGLSQVEATASGELIVAQYQVNTTTNPDAAAGGVLVLDPATGEVLAYYQPTYQGGEGIASLHPRTLTVSPRILDDGSEVVAVIYDALDAAGAPAGHNLMQFLAYDPATRRITPLSNFVRYSTAEERIAQVGFDADGAVWIAPADGPDHAREFAYWAAVDGLPKPCREFYAWGAR